jgi:hypothetical protein
MGQEFRALVTFTIAGCVCLAGWSASIAQEKGPIMSAHAKGTFDVKMTPASEDKTESSTLGRMTNEKQFHGDLEGSSKGEMLTAGTAVKGSAAYVLIERVTANLQGRRGTFVLHHSATLTRGAPQQVITVVPDSGSGELTGIAGSLTIDIRDGKHFYDLAYTLPDHQ